MSVLEITEVQRHYHLPESQTGIKGNIDQVTETFLREHLPQGLSEVGLHESEVICIKQLELHLPFDSDESSTQRDAHWLTLLVNHLAELQSRGKVHQWLRYANLPTALITIGRELARNDLQRAWAWRMMGVTKSAQAGVREATNQWLDFLAIHPETVFSVINKTIQQGVLYALLRQGLIKPSGLAGLADVLFRFLDATMPEVEFPMIDHSKEQVNVFACEVDALGEAEKQLYRLLLSLSSAPGNTMDTSQSLTQLSQDDRARLVKCCFWPCLSHIARRSNHGYFSAQNLSLAVKLAIENLSVIASESSANGIEQNKGIAGLQDANLQLPAQIATSVPGKAEGSVEPCDTVPLLSGEKQPAQFGHYGGMVMLLNVVEKLGVIDALQQDTFAKYPLPDLLTCFCLTLEPESAGDIAVKVFAGSLFTEPHLPLGLPIDNEHREAIVQLAAQFRCELNQYFASLTGTEIEENHDFLPFICRRPIRVEAESGWVKVFFPFDTIDTRLRRAGLDLDPDFVPWLGYVVKIYYE